MRDDESDEHAAANKVSDIVAITAIIESQEEYIQQPSHPLLLLNRLFCRKEGHDRGQASDCKYHHGFNNVCMQPDELEEGVYDFERPVWGDRH